MSKGYKWVVCFASCLSLIQSIIWTGVSVAGALIYLDVITVSPYRTPTDFFPVTLAKLYFEGPHSKIDGSYLGKFGDEYRKIDVIDLFWPDKVFAIAIAYIIINVFYFFISTLLYFNRNPKNRIEGKRLLDITLGWSCVTYLLCAVDALFVYFLFRDFLQIRDYINKSDCFTGKDISLYCKNVSDLPYVPLVLALIPGRFGILWIWNFISANLLFFDAVCCKKILKGFPKPKKEPTQEGKPTAPPKPPQVLPPVKLINKSYSTSYDVRRNRDLVDVRRSVEAITSFSDDCEKPQGCRLYPRIDWDHSHPDGSIHSVATWHSKVPFREWSAINEGYESDENGSVVLEHTSCADQSEELGQKKIKIVRPPIGKPAEDAGNERSGKAGSSR